MSGKGRVFSDEWLQRIVKLLSTTDMAIGDIALRMNCSRSAVLSINRKFVIRDYAGRKATWIQHEHGLRRG